MSKRYSGPLLVAGASFLWGTDALFRYPISETIDPTFIVFCEHLLGTLILALWVAARHRHELFKLDRAAWLAAMFVGVMGSAIATALLTASFRYANPSVAILLQKLQPVLVVAFAVITLGERPARGFYFWGAVALGAGIVLSFPDLKADLFSESMATRTRGIAYAFGASMIWAASTVAGKTLLKRVHPTVGVFWRYAIGLVTLGAMLGISQASLSANAHAARGAASSIFYLALFAGILPYVLYYGGLKRTPASVTTFIELLYPVSAVILNTVFLNTPLSNVQLLAGSILLFAVTRIST